MLLNAFEPTSTIFSFTMAKLDGSRYSNLQFADAYHKFQSFKLVEYKPLEMKTFLCKACHSLFSESVADCLFQPKQALMLLCVCVC